MATPPTDPKNPKAKPHGTTEDQIKEMESEGPAPFSPPSASGKVESPSADSMQGAPGPKAGPEDVPGANSDQDIDTAGTEADDHR
jgi:hypothetical protein